MSLRHLAVIFMFLSTTVATAAQKLLADPIIRVHAFTTSGTVSVKTEAVPCEVLSENDKVLVTLPEQRESTVTLNADSIDVVSEPGGKAHRISRTHGELRLRNQDGTGTVALGVTGRSRNAYPGEVTIIPRQQEYDVVVKLPLEEYLRGVVPSEIGATAPAQAQCAQAVAARSYAVLAIVNKKHEKDPYDICSTVHCQVFSGLSKATKATDEAVTATRGLVITYNGKPIPAYYSSMCGGHTEDIRTVWPGRGEQSAYHDADRTDGPKQTDLDLTNEGDFRKYIASNPQVYCNPDAFKVLGWAGKNFRWTREITAEKVTEFVAKKKDIGRVLAMKPGPRGKSGRFKHVEFVGEKGNLVVEPEIEIRRLFDPALRSGAFTIETSGTAERATGFVFTGTGSGHGVGMCQTGAMGMANDGKGFREILSHYYPKATVESAY